MSEQKQKGITRETLKFVFKTAWKERPSVFLVYLMKFISEFASKMQNAIMAKLIIDELREISKKYGQPRRTMFLYDVEESADIAEEPVKLGPVNIFLTREGYFKKITPQSLRMSNQHKLKENDEIIWSGEVNGGAELLFFTDMHQVYKTRCTDFDETKFFYRSDSVKCSCSKK